MSIKGIDYSKWDHLVDSDDDENAGDETSLYRPRVTRLDRPSRITTTSDGTIQVVQSEFDRSPGKAQPESQPKASLSTSQRSPQPIIPASWTKAGGAVDDFQGRHLYWSQDRYAVQVRIQLDPNVSPKSLKLRHAGKIYGYVDRNAAVGSDNTASLELLSDEETVFQVNVAYPIHFHQDENGELDWEIQYDGESHRYIVLTLPKASPMEGLTLQWRRPFLQLPERDINNDEETRKRQSSFQESWDLAHAALHEKIQKGELPRHSLD
jgi:hypothetical protein